MYRNLVLSNRRGFARLKLAAVSRVGFAAPSTIKLSAPSRAKFAARSAVKPIARPEAKFAARSAVDSNARPGATFSALSGARLIALTAVFVGALSIAGCAKAPELPPAKPLSAPAAQLAQIPYLERGNYTVQKTDAFDWKLPDRELRVRVVQPEGDGTFPLVVFSHGNWSDIDKYDALLEHWASYGYIIVSPYHLDGGGAVRGIYNSLINGNAGLIAARTDDIKATLDNIANLDTLTPGLSKRIDTTRIAVAGHSFGAFTAQQLGGAAAIDPDTGERTEGRDGRVRAVLAISPPGPMFGLINDKSWLDVDVPMLVTTGTWDVNARFWPDWREHTLSYRTAKPGHNWLLVVEGADHYLGNLICRPEREVAPQTDALRIVNGLSVTFLDAFVKDDANARAFLNDAQLSELTNGFAALTHR